MNFKIVQQIVSHTKIRDTHDFAVLMVLAYHADEKGECWPSVPTIAHEARLSKGESARVILRRLEQAGYFTVEKGNGRGHRSHYKLHIGQGSEVGRKARSSSSTDAEKPPSERAFNKGPLRKGASEKALSQMKNPHPERAFLDAPEISNVVSVEESNKQNHVVASSGEIANHAELAAQLAAFGISAATAEQLAADYPQRIAAQIEWLEARKPRDRAATLVKAIRQNWAAPPSIRRAESPERPTEARTALEPQEWQAKGEKQKAAVNHDETEGVALDAEFAALGPEEQAEIEAACEQRMAFMPPFMRTEQAFKVMRRTLLRERKTLG